MNPFIIFALLAAGAVGWIACRVVRRRYEMELEKRMDESSGVTERCMLNAAMNYRSVLQALEAGDIHGAKTDLSTSLAIVYCVRKDGQRRLEKLGIVPDDSDFAKIVMCGIEEDAERFEILRLAIEKEKQGDPDSEIGQILKELDDDR